MQRQVFNCLALLYVADARFDDAERLLDRALIDFQGAQDAVPADSIKLLDLRAALHTRKGEWREAEQDLRDAVWGLAGPEIHYQYQDTILRNKLGLRQSSLLPATRRSVMRVERAASYSRILQLPVRHYFPMLASIFTVLAMWLRKRPNANTLLVGNLFAAGFAILFPLLLITPAADWRYLGAANVFWACSFLIGAASFAVPGWNAAETGEARVSTADKGANNRDGSVVAV